MNLHLMRIGESLGVLIGPNGVICYIMEPPWRDNRRNVSCIPEGKYQVKYLPRSASGKYKDCYHVTGVKNRTGVLFHKGNTVNDTMGCMLPGSRVGTLGGKMAVLGSAAAMRKIHKLTNRKEFTLDVRNFIAAG